MRRWRPTVPQVLMLLAVAVVIVVRLRLLNMPLERDEGEFAYGGQLMLEGIPPYQLLYNMKFPGIYAAYALCLRLFGQTPAGIHFGLLLVNLACVFLLYRLALRFMNSAGASAAAAAYAFLSTSPFIFGLAAHATHFVVAAALGGLLLLWQAEKTSRRGVFFWSGTLFGLACLMKQPGALFGFFAFTTLAGRAICERTRWREYLQRMALLMAGGIAPLALTALVLWRAGVFERFWFWTVVYAKAHASEYPLSVGWTQLKAFFSELSFADGFLWILAGLGLVSLAFPGGDGRKKIWLAAFFVFSAVAVSLSNYFTKHYFIMIFPALALLIGRLVGMGAEQRTLRGRAPGVLLAVVCLLDVIEQRQIFFVLSPDQVCKVIYGANPFVESREIGRYLREHTAPDARIAVLGSEPEIFFYARRHSATGYVYTYNFYEPQPYIIDMQREMISEIEQARPEYVVFLKIAGSWDAWPDFSRVANTPVMNWAPKFVLTDYTPAGLVIVRPESEYYWDKDAMNRPPVKGWFISIFKRK